jgi:hypothetical protein
MTEQSVYILKPILDDPRFEGLQFDKRYPSFFGEGYLFEDFIPKFNGKTYSVSSFDKKWSRDIRVKGPVRSFNDYPCINLSEPAFSPHAVSVLRSILEANGELLPVKHPSGQFVLFNLRHLSNALNQRRSRIQMTSSGKSVRVEWYEFFKSRIANETIFRVAQCPWAIHVTETFRVRVVENCLNGFNFIKVWPLSSDVDWRDLETTARKKRGKSHKLIGETLILRFRYCGDTATKQEANAINQIESQLQVMLTNQKKPNDPLYGSIASSESTSGEHRIFISCPSVDLLEEHLFSWLQAVSYPQEFHIVKRWGHLADTHAKEQRVKIQ